MTVDFTVLCVRYSDDPQAMSAFAEVVGLSRRISSTTSGYVDLAGAAGLLMVHPADDDGVAGQRSCPTRWRTSTPRWRR